MNKRPYLSWFDSSSDIPVQQQGDDPAGLQFVPIGVNNKRIVLSGDQVNSYTVGDLTVNPRGAKSIIWSSEGYTFNGNAIPALTANQKKATGDHTANAGTGVVLDFSPYRNLSLMVVLASFTGGSSPTIQFELDLLDDAGTANSVALWKPTAAAAAASYLVSVGPGSAFAQAAAAPSTAGAGFGAITVPSGWTYYSYPLAFTPNGKIAWTVANTPTAVAWTAFLYGTA